MWCIVLLAALAVLALSALAYGYALYTDQQVELNALQKKVNHKETPILNQNVEEPEIKEESGVTGTTTTTEHTSTDQTSQDLVQVETTTPTQPDEEIVEPTPTEQPAPESVDPAPTPSEPAKEIGDTTNNPSDPT